MVTEEIDELKQRILDLISKHQFYNRHHDLKIMCDQGNSYLIVWGDIIANGVVGSGSTTNSAFEDFADNWEHYIARKQREIKHD